MNSHTKFLKKMQKEYEEQLLNPIHYDSEPGPYSWFGWALVIIFVLGISIIIMALLS